MCSRIHEASSCAAELKHADTTHFIVARSQTSAGGHLRNDYVIQDPRGVSCAAKFEHADTANFVKRDGAWTHMAVTWTAANDGLTTIYQDGGFPAMLAACQRLQGPLTTRTADRRYARCSEVGRNTVVLLPRS